MEESREEKMEELRSQLIQALAGRSLQYIPIEDASSLAKIHALWTRGNFSEPSTDIEDFYYGAYFQYVDPKPDRMMTYYNRSIEEGNGDSMGNLGCYYRDQNDYAAMKKFWYMAVESGNKRIIPGLAEYVIRFEGGRREALNLYMIDPDLFQYRITELLRDGGAALSLVKDYQKIIGENEATIRENDQLKEHVRCLKAKVRELKYRPGGVKFEAAKTHFESLQ